MTFQFPIRLRTRKPQDGTWPARSHSFAVFNTPFSARAYLANDHFSYQSRHLAVLVQMLQRFDALVPITGSDKGFQKTGQLQAGTGLSQAAAKVKPRSM
jgi:hypothetical protein